MSAGAGRLSRRRASSARPSSARAARACRACRWAGAAAPRRSQPSAGTCRRRGGGGRSRSARWRGPGQLPPGPGQFRHPVRARDEPRITHRGPAAHHYVCRLVRRQPRPFTRPHGAAPVARARPRLSTGGGHALGTPCRGNGPGSTRSLQTSEPFSAPPTRGVESCSPPCPTGVTGSPNSCGPTQNPCTFVSLAISASCLVTIPRGIPVVPLV
jgi:hypothetical protein